MTKSIRTQNKRIVFSVIVPSYNRCEPLTKTLRSLFDQEFPRDSYEIIVVDDGSSDNTASYLASLNRTEGVLWKRINNSGPSIARNAGAAIARGMFLAFIDDDCTAPRNWLAGLHRTFVETGAGMVGGSVRNVYREDPYAVAYDHMHQFFSQAQNIDPWHPQFLTSNNLACSSLLFEEAGRFDERFFLGGEDKELALRFLALGKKVLYRSDVVVEHHRSFTFTKLCVHYYQFGTASHLLHNVIGRRSARPTGKLSLAQFALLFLSAGRGSTMRMRIFGLTVIAQLFAFLGYWFARWEGIDRIRKHGSRMGTNDEEKTLNRHHAPRLLTFLGGTVVSSTFGFLAVVLIGRFLNGEPLGIFMTLFSSTSIIVTLIVNGFSASVTRYASEYVRKGDTAGESAVLNSAARLVCGVIVILSCIAFAVFQIRAIGEVFSDTTILLPLLVIGGMSGGILFEFLNSVYLIHHETTTLSLIRTIVSVLRFGSIGFALMLNSFSPIILYSAFFLPTWVGTFIVLPRYLRAARTRQSNGHTRTPSYKEQLAYSGWQALSTTISSVLYQAGAPLLMGFAMVKEAGFYGLGLSLSFIYSVLAVSLGSFFLPLGAQLFSDEELPELIRRTLRLGFPCMLISIVSILFASPIVRFLFGPEKISSAPVFALISLGYIFSIGFPVLNVSFHYFFKPSHITLSQISQLVVFVILLIPLLGLGATGVALAFLLSRIASLTVGFILLHRELFERNIVVPPRTWLTFGFSPVALSAEGGSDIPE